MSSNPVSETRKALNARELHRLGSLGQLPDWLTDAAILELWWPAYGQKLNPLERVQRAAIAETIANAVKGGQLNADVVVGETVTVHAPVGGWGTPFRGFRRSYDDAVDDLHTRTASRSSKLPDVTWIHRNALRQWLSLTESPLVPAGAPLRSWWPDAADWKIGAAKPQKIKAPDLVGEVADYRVRTGSGDGEAVRVVAAKYRIKEDTLDRARKRHNAKARQPQADALRAAGNVACAKQAKTSSGKLH